LRNIEGHIRFAIRPDGDDAGEQRHRRLRRRRSIESTALGIIAAAGANLTGRAERPIDQLAIDVAPVIAELALPEIPGVRLRRLEAREIENAEIDRRDGYIGFLALRQSGQC